MAAIPSVTAACCASGADRRLDAAAQRHSRKGCAFNPRCKVFAS
jgi:hypothetical protein